MLDRRIACSLLTLGLMLQGCAHTTPGSGWWTYRKDAANSSRYTGSDVAPPLELVWQKALTLEGVEVASVGPPVFGQDHLYVAVDDADEVGPTSRLVALRLTDGSEAWSFTPQQPLSALHGRPPVVANERIYVAFEVTSEAGNLQVHALDVNGVPQWSWLPDSFTARMEGPMTAANGLLLFVTAGGGEFFLQALHQDSGAEAWRVRIDGTRPPRHGVVVGHDSIWMTTDADLRALTLDGVERWRFAYPEAGRPGPIAFHVFSPHHRPHICVPVATGLGPAGTPMANVHCVSQRGTLDTTIPVAITGVQHLGVTFLVPGTRPLLFAGTSIYSLGAWTATDPDDHVIQSTPALTIDHIFFTNSRRLHALRAIDGVNDWSADLANAESGAFRFQTLVGGVAIDRGLVAAVGFNHVQLFRKQQ